MLSSTTQKFLRVSASLRISIYLESLIEIPSMVKKEIFLKNPRLHLLTSLMYFSEWAREAGAIHMTASTQSSFRRTRSQATFVFPLPIFMKSAPAFRRESFSTALF